MAQSSMENSWYRHWFTGVSSIGSLGYFQDVMCFDRLCDVSGSAFLVTALTSHVNTLMPLLKESMFQHCIALFPMFLLFDRAWRLLIYLLFCVCLKTVCFFSFEGVCRPFEKIKTSQHHTSSIDLIFISPDS